MLQFVLNGADDTKYGFGFRNDGKAYLRAANTTLTSVNSVINFGEVKWDSRYHLFRVRRNLNNEFDKP